MSVSECSCPSVSAAASSWCTSWATANGAMASNSSIKPAATLHCSNRRTRRLAILLFMNDFARLIDLIKQPGSLSDIDLSTAANGDVGHAPSKETLRSMDVRGLSNPMDGRGTENLCHLLPPLR